MLRTLKSLRHLHAGQLKCVHFPPFTDPAPQPHLSLLEGADWRCQHATTGSLPQQHQNAKHATTNLRQATWGLLFE
eukprot:3092476-Amphidinium_carterae.1